MLKTIKEQIGQGVRELVAQRSLKGAEEIFRNLRMTAAAVRLLRGLRTV